MGLQKFDVRTSASLSILAFQNWFNMFMSMLSSANRTSVILIGLAVLSLIVPGCGKDSTELSEVKTPTISADSKNNEHVATIRTFCAACHAFPDPNSFAKADWKAEVSQGFRLYYDDPREGLILPPEDATVAYFESLAPEQIPIQPETGLPETSRFVRQKAQGVTVNAGAISCIRFDQVSQKLWASDMRNGVLFSASPGEPLTVAARPLQLTNPCRITPADLNGDGAFELLVSDLGGFLPADHLLGSAWQLTPEENWKAEPILEGVSRVSDIQAGDLDGDGDSDLVVAEFGWRRTGQLLILWNDGNQAWRKEVLDARHGAIDVPIVDLNADGRPDIVALLAQEHEAVVVYFNQPDGTFKATTIFEAKDPSFGSTGVKVVDLDLDGDFDLVHTNGDSFDDGHLNPFHGVRWLENKGEQVFEVHELANMFGVHCASAGDLDLDGDIDLVAVGLLPPNAESATDGIASVIWLEQTENGKFTKHLLEVNNADHAACELVDWDSDGDLDICLAHFRWDDQPGPAVSWLKNLTITQTANRGTDLLLDSKMSASPAQRVSE